MDEARVTGFDSLVDELMYCHGYDRAEAELLAEAKLAAGEEGAYSSRAEIAPRTPSPDSPAASFVTGHRILGCECPCEGGDECVC